MTNPFDCDAFAGHLAAHLEGDAPAAVSAAMATHASSCASCLALLTDIETIQRDAAGLPMFAPSRDLWSGIAERIETRVVPLSSATRRAAAPQRHRRWYAHPAVAAAALVAITAGVTHFATLRAGSGAGAGTSIPQVVQVAPVVDDSGVRIDVQAPAHVASGDVGSSASPAMVARAASDASVASAASAARITPGSGGSRRTAPASPRTAAVVQVAYRDGATAALDSLYYREITRLRQLLRARRSDLAPATVQVIDRNMLVIDRAIRECREALAKDPASTFLNEQLNEALESKIELLRTAATMPVGA